MSGHLDTTIAAFIIALGAIAYDMEVDMFFTFWATAALRDPKKSPKEGLSGQNVRLDAAAELARSAAVEDADSRHRAEDDPLGYETARGEIP